MRGLVLAEHRRRRRGVPRVPATRRPRRREARRRVVRAHRAPPRRRVALEERVLEHSLRASHDGDRAAAAGERLAPRVGVDGDLVPDEARDVRARGGAPVAEEHGAASVPIVVRHDVSRKRRGFEGDARAAVRVDRPALLLRDVPRERAPKNARDAAPEEDGAALADVRRVRVDRAGGRAPPGFVSLERALQERRARARAEHRDRAASAVWWGGRTTVTTVRVCVPRVPAAADRQVLDERDADGDERSGGVFENAFENVFVVVDVFVVELRLMKQTSRGRSFVLQIAHRGRGLVRLRPRARCRFDRGAGADVAVAFVDFFPVVGPHNYRPSCAVPSVARAAELEVREGQAPAITHVEQRALAVLASRASLATRGPVLPDEDAAPRDRALRRAVAARPADRERSRDAQGERAPRVIGRGEVAVQRDMRHAGVDRGVELGARCHEARPASVAAPRDAREGRRRRGVRRGFRGGDEAEAEAEAEGRERGRAHGGGFVGYARRARVRWHHEAAPR